jgi:hydroxymethylpyrimidine/phosphomethylpyrimidine kinase
VIVAKSGDRLLREDAVRALREELLPAAHVLTPNLPEASDILGRRVATLEEMPAAARALHALGAANVVMKGGHLESDTVTDILFDGERFHDFAGPRIATKNTHGTGCTFSSAIAAGLAKGMGPGDAIALAKSYVTLAIQHAYPIGKGHGPVHHFYRYYQPTGPKYKPGVAIT